MRIQAEHAAQLGRASAARQRLVRRAELALVEVEQRHARREPPRQVARLRRREADEREQGAHGRRREGRLPIG